ncbi:BamA/TamA family outer membrane protein [Deinococcus malanensis]|uniref:BamA/TamA family outer membrane protein n=1 Tax=Deinococcus malanensis TaxID=1706855 RepID=UPI0036459B0A
MRANAGTTFGNYPEGTGYSVGGGSSPVAARQIRGLADGELFGTNYFTTSAEYRYDFGLNAGIAQGLYGVVFADAGSAWGTTNNPNFDLKYGIGAGVQLDLGFGGARLPSLRFDYGFSPQNGSGKFYFRLGNFW